MGETSDLYNAYNDNGARSIDEIVKFIHRELKQGKKVSVKLDKDNVMISNSEVFYKFLIYQKLSGEKTRRVYCYISFQEAQTCLDELSSEINPFFYNQLKKTNKDFLLIYPSPLKEIREVLDQGDEVRIEFSAVHHENPLSSPPKKYLCLDISSPGLNDYTFYSPTQAEYVDAKTAGSHLSEIMSLFGKGYKFKSSNSDGCGNYLIIYKDPSLIKTQKIKSERKKVKTGSLS